MTDEGNIPDAADILAIIDQWMESYDFMGTGSCTSEDLAQAEWLKDRAKIAAFLAAPSYADAIRDCLGAVEAAREKAIHSRSVDYINGVREGHARSIRAIEALTPGSPL